MSSTNFGSLTKPLKLQKQNYFNQLNNLAKEGLSSSNIFTDTNANIYSESYNGNKKINFQNNKINEQITKAKPDLSNIYRCYSNSRADTEIKNYKKLNSKNCLTKNNYLDESSNYLKSPDQVINFKGSKFLSKDEKKIRLDQERGRSNEINYNIGSSAYLKTDVYSIKKKSYNNLNSFTRNKQESSSKNENKNSKIRDRKNDLSPFALTKRVDNSNILSVNSNKENISRRQSNNMLTPKVKQNIIIDAEKKQVNIQYNQMHPNQLVSGLSSNAHKKTFSEDVQQVNVTNINDNFRHLNKVGSNKLIENSYNYTNNSNISNTNLYAITSNNNAPNQNNKNNANFNQNISQVFLKGHKEIKSANEPFAKFNTDKELKEKLNAAKTPLNLKNLAKIKSEVDEKNRKKNKEKYQTGLGDAETYSSTKTCGDKKGHSSMETTSVNKNPSFGDVHTPEELHFYYITMLQNDTYNGNSLVGMVGDKCVAIGSDQRIGIQYTTVGSNMQKIFKIQDNILMGLSGLATDIQRFALEMRRKVELYRIKEDIDLTPQLFINLVASTLYEHRFGPFYVKPIVVGLDVNDNYKSYVASYDSIGCITQSGEFDCAGTSEEMLYGVCEAFFKPKMNPDEIFETCSQCLLSGIERDCFSGWGAVVYLMTPGKIECKRIKCRQD